MLKNYPIVEKQVTFLIFPFAYQVDYNDTEAFIDQTIFAETKLDLERLFDHVENLVGSHVEKEESIGKRYVLMDKARTKIQLPNRKDTLLTFKKTQQEFSFSIESLELYLFETQVGFVLLKIGHPAQCGIGQMIESNYYLKKLARLRNETIFYDKKTGKDTSVRVDIELTNLVESLISKLNVDTYFEGDHTKIKQGLVYSAAVLDLNERPEIVSYLYRMQRGFKDSYKPNLNKESSGILTSFENSYWGASLEGIANIITKTGDSTTDLFFSTDYFHRLENTYLYLYILALHQRYALLYLSKKISLLPHELSLVQKQPEIQNQLVTTYRRKIVNFMLKCSYNQVSNITHQNNLYEMVRDQLKIQSLFNEIQDELNALSSLTDIFEQRHNKMIEDRKQLKGEKFNRGLSYLTALFLPLTVVSGLYGMNIDLVKQFAGDTRLFGTIIVATYFLALPILFKFWWSKSKE